MMTKKNISVLVLTLTLVTAALYWKWGATTHSKKSQIETTAKEESYYTCPMHPNIHSDKQGDCPICHMKLVKVTKNPESASPSESAEKRSPVHATSAQLELLGLQKEKVEKMSLTMTLPISGRFLSNSSVAFQVYENDLRYIKPNLNVFGESQAYPEQTIEGKISSVDSVVDPTSRTTRVVAQLTKQIKDPIHEMSFRGKIQIRLNDRLFIPERAVLHTGAEDLVYIFDSENKLQAKKVKLGAKTESFYEVLDGLSEGDTISSGPNFLIDSEARIRGVND